MKVICGFDDRVEVFEFPAELEIRFVMNEPRQGWLRVITRNGDSWYFNMDFVIAVAPL